MLAGLDAAFVVGAGDDLLLVFDAVFAGIAGLEVQQQLIFGAGEGAFGVTADAEFFSIARFAGDIQAGFVGPDAAGGRRGNGRVGGADGPNGDDVGHGQLDLAEAAGDAGFAIAGRDDDGGDLVAIGGIDHHGLVAGHAGDVCAVNAELAGKFRRDLHFAVKDLQIVALDDAAVVQHDLVGPGAMHGQRQNNQSSDNFLHFYSCFMFFSQ